MLLYNWKILAPWYQGGNGIYHGLLQQEHQRELPSKMPCYSTSATSGSSQPATPRSGEPAIPEPCKQAEAAQTDRKWYMSSDKDAPLREKIGRVEHNATNSVMDMEGL